MYKVDPPCPSGCDAWLPSVSLQVPFSAGSPCEVAWSLFMSAALWRAVYGSPVTREEKGIFPYFRFLSHSEVAKADENPYHPSFLVYVCMYVCLCVSLNIDLSLFYSSYG